MAKYGDAIDRESAFEMIQDEREQNAAAEELARERAEFEAQKAEFAKQQEEAKKAAEKEAERIAAEQAALAEEQARIQAAEQALAKARTTDASSAMSQLAEVDWSCGKDAFISEWANRINNYLAGSPLAGQGETFAAAAWENGVDPRWSPAISNTESTKGANCFLPHNAWGWGSTGWSSWEEAINAHVAGLAKGYGYTISYSNAQKYCPPNYDNWFRDTLREMSKI